MQADLTVKLTTTINANPARVWQALIDFEMTKKYMYDTGVKSTWEVGSDVDWFGPWEGKDVKVMTGKLLAFEPESLLQYTSFWLQSGRALVPENFLTVTCRLEDQGGNTELTIEQGDFSVFEDGQARHDETAGMWQAVFQGMKSLLED